MSIVSRFLDQTSDDADGFRLTPLRRRHVRAVLEIEEASYPKPWTAGVFNSEIDLARRGERHYVAAFENAELVGYGGLMFAVDEAHITNIAVSPHHHRHGYATRILLHLAHEAITRGFGALTLEVRVSNTAAQELYRRFGFVPAGIRKNYYEGVEDAVVMWCHDIDSESYAERLRGLEAGIVR